MVAHCKACTVRWIPIAQCCYGCKSLLPLFCFIGYWINPQSESESQHSNYRAGFNACAARVRRFMENQPGVNPKLQEQILESLTASHSYIVHTNQTFVNKNTSMSFTPGQAVYGVCGLQTTSEPPRTCAFTPPPSPPQSSAFRPYDRSETTTLTDGSSNSPDNCYSTAHIKRSIVEPCKLSLWRPWIPSSQHGQI